MKPNCDSLPLRIVVDVSRRCNEKCWYCHSSSGPDYQEPVLTAKQVQSIIKLADKLSVFDVTITGGEPFMWCELDDLLSFMPTFHFPSVQIITNGTMVSKVKADALKRAGISRVCISIDCLKPIHDANRGHGSFDKTIEGLNALTTVFDNVTVISVLDTYTFDRWPEFTKLLVKLGVSSHHLSPVCYSGCAVNQYRGLSSEQFNEVRSMVENIRSTLPKNFDLRFNDILFQDYSCGSELSLIDYVERNKGWQLLVRPTGNVEYSTGYWGRNWDRPETLGNIQQTSIDEIWFSSQNLRLNLVNAVKPIEIERASKFKLYTSKFNL